MDIVKDTNTEDNENINGQDIEEYEDARGTTKSKENANLDDTEDETMIHIHKIKLPKKNSKKERNRDDNEIEDMESENKNENDNEETTSNTNIVDSENPKATGEPFIQAGPDDNDRDVENSDIGQDVEKDVAYTEKD